MTSKTIFFVDDDASIRKIFGRVLARHRPGDNRKEFGNPTDVLNAVLNGERVDLIITDGEMPEMDGADLAAKLHYAGYQVRVIVLTANLNIKAPLTGVAEVVYKPISVSDFIDLIDRHLGSQEAT